MDFYLYEHIDNDSVELIGYNAGLFLEFQHVYLVKSMLYEVVEAEAQRRYQAQHKVSLKTNPHLPMRNSKTVAHLHDSPHVIGRSQSDLSLRHEEHPLLELSEIKDAAAGEYVFDHMVSPR